MTPYELALKGKRTIRNYLTKNFFKQYLNVGMFYDKANEWCYKVYLKKDLPDWAKAECLKAAGPYPVKFKIIEEEVTYDHCI